jgi:hypothetical protein
MQRFPRLIAGSAMIVAGVLAAGFLPSLAANAIAGPLIVAPSRIWSLPAAGASPLFVDNFSYPDGLITNEYAYWNPGSARSRISHTWELTSGSLFARGATGWTGVPDDIEPNAASSKGTDSAIFRMNTKRADFGDVTVSMRLLVNRLTSTRSTPRVAWDGVHIFLRYQSQYNLYYASVARRDGTVVIKKKCVGGPDNGGTYYELTRYVPGHAIPLGSWHPVAASVHNDTGGSVTVKLYRDGTLLAAGVDRGVGCAPIRSAGAVGIRGDNADIQFDAFTVTNP